MKVEKPKGCVCPQRCLINMDPPWIQLLVTTHCMTKQSTTCRHKETVTVFPPKNELIMKKRRIEKKRNSSQPPSDPTPSIGISFRRSYRNAPKQGKRARRGEVLYIPQGVQEGNQRRGKTGKEGRRSTFMPCILTSLHISRWIHRSEKNNQKWMIDGMDWFSL